LSKTKVTLTAQSGSLASWWLLNRNGGLPAGTVYNGLVSDLAANDYLVGARARVAATGATTSGNRALTLDRNGVQFAVTWPAAATVQLIR
jgi:hypothetical protein